MQTKELPVSYSLSAIVHLSVLSIGAFLFTQGVDSLVRMSTQIADQRQAEMELRICAQRRANVANVNNAASVLAREFPTRAAMFFAAASRFMEARIESPQTQDCVSAQMPSLRGGIRQEHGTDLPEPWPNWVVHIFAVGVVL